MGKGEGARLEGHIPFTTAPPPPLVGNLDDSSSEATYNWVPLESPK